ncbi:hypothetical protein M9H77_32148 [Catharanthus roseus]|uniref:Uncharacterized protein n=1 Tax=Catharanthus roseus TaxID=4058 RepID=A0ACC0A600_CATRO|nr:hypothetical protein M9H77_32148 [Catharanthus roseus]
MEEFPAHVHPGPLVPDVLTRKHEHRSGLIWSGDHEKCHMLPDMSGSLNQVWHISLLEDFDGHQHLHFRSCATDRGSPCATSDLGLIVSVYHTSLHWQSSSRDIRTFGYQPAGVDRRMMEIDDMTIGPIPERGARGMKRGPHKLPGRADPGHRGERGGGSGRQGHGDPGSYPPSSAGGASYAPPPPSAVRLSFDAPLPPGTAGSSVPHMPISRAFSSDSNEQSDDLSDDVTLAQQLGIGHRVRSKTTRSTPSDYR